MQEHRTFCLTMRYFSNVLKKKTLPPDFFGDVLEKVKHRTNDASNDVSRPAIGWGPRRIPPGACQLTSKVAHSQPAKTTSFNFGQNLLI